MLSMLSEVVSRNTTLVPSLGLRIGPACEAGLSANMRRERVSPQIRKKERKRDRLIGQNIYLSNPLHSTYIYYHTVWCRKKLG